MVNFCPEGMGHCSTLCYMKTYMKAFIIGCDGIHFKLISSTRLNTEKTWPLIPPQFLHSINEIHRSTKLQIKKWT